MPLSDTPSSWILNGVVIEAAPDSVITVGKQAYRDDAQLRELRSSHRGTHFFKRQGSTILSVALEESQRPIGSSLEDVKVSQSASLVSALVLDSLLRYFHAHKRPIFTYKPLRIVSGKKGDELVSTVLTRDAKHLPWPEQRVTYVFDTRVLYKESGQPMVLLVCDARTSYLIPANCAALLAAGIPLDGRYVQARRLGDDLRLAAKPKLVGRVERVDGEQLILEDHAPEYPSIQSVEAYLEPRYENVKWCLRHLYPGNPEALLAKLDAVAESVTKGPPRLERINATLDHLRGETLELSPGLPLTLGPLLRRDSEATWFPRCEVLERPALLFDPGSNRTDKWSERGLDQHGPYDRVYFTPKIPRIAVVCEAEAQGLVEQFMRKFVEGLPDIRPGYGPSKRAPYGKGFIRRYFTDRPHIEVFVASAATATAYKNACRKALEHAANAGYEWNLAFVQIDEVFQQLHGDDDPYLVAKSTFMRRNVPVQEMTLEKMLSPAEDLVYILSDISLAVYAKLGGTPWLLKADTTIAHELVFGIGSYHVRASRIGAPERHVGITTVFTGDGKYLLESQTHATPYAEYVGALLSTLKRAMEEIRRQQNWRDSDAIRLIFHVFKPLKDAEAEAVISLVNELGLPNCEFAFIHVVDDHPFILFDEAMRGNKKGALAPDRGSLVKLTRDEILLSFTGPHEIKQSRHGMPRPVLLKLHRKSSFKDLRYLANQAFAFASHSWRGFAPAPLPITVLYSQLIAELLSKLDNVSDWDPEAMLGKIGRTRWFL